MKETVIRNVDSNKLLKMLMGVYAWLKGYDISMTTQTEFIECNQADIDTHLHANIHACMLE